MNEFKKYNSIENSYRSEFIERLINEDFDKQEFVVQEKVHGANLSFWCDGDSIRCAKRTGFIEEGEGFYEFSSVLNKYHDPIYKLFDFVTDKYKDTSFITIYGELFGGAYPHSEVTKDRDAIVIQKGVYYSPSNDYYAFDIMLDNKKYLSVDEANNFFENSGFFYAKTLYKGDLKSSLDFLNSFESCISKWLGLPAIENNICEGTIIKPAIPAFLKNGSRVIIKNKNSKWEENKKKKKMIKTPDNYSELLKALLDATKEYINVNRLNNTISKVGPVDTNNFGKVVGLFNKDILEDFVKDYSDEFERLEKNEQKMIRKSVNTNASKLINQYLKDN